MRFLEDVSAYLSEEQKGVLETLNEEEGYSLVENNFSDLELPPNQIQRNLDLLAGIGLVKIS